MPDTLALELEDRDLGFRPLQHRNASLVEVATLLVDSASVFVTIVVNSQNLRAAVGRFVAHAQQAADDRPAVEIAIKVDGKAYTISDENTDAGIERIEVRICSLLAADDTVAEP